MHAIWRSLIGFAATTCILFSLAYGQSTAVTLNFVTLTAPHAAIGAPIAYQLAVTNTGSTTIQIITNVQLVAPDATVYNIFASQPTLAPGQVKIAAGQFTTKNLTSQTGGFVLKGFTRDIVTKQIVYETDIPLVISTVPANGVYASIGGQGPASAVLGYTTDFEYVVANLGSTIQTLTVNTTLVDPNGTQYVLTTGKAANYKAGANTVSAGETGTTQYSALTGAWSVRVDVLNGSKAVIATDTFSFTRNPLPSTIFVPTFTNTASTAGIDVQRTFINNKACGPATDKIPGGVGAAVADYDGDGLEDLFVNDINGNNHLWRNNGDGTFTDMAAAAGLPVGVSAVSSSGSSFADIDNDGNPDLLILFNQTPNRLFHNNGNGTFTEITATAGINQVTPQNNISATWGDYDNDGYLDLYVTVHADCNGTNQNDHLYHNNGNLTFTDVTNLLGGSTAADVNGRGMVVEFVDYNQDGRVDIYLGNDVGTQSFSHPNVLWRNDGSDGKGGWIFTDVSAASGAGVAVSSMGIGQSDYNRTGRYSLLVTNFGPNFLLQQQSGNTFLQEQGDNPGGAHVARGNVPKPSNPGTNQNITWGTAFYDFDNDTWEDIYMAGGSLLNGPTQYPGAFFLNNQDGTFLDLTILSGTATVNTSEPTAVFADFNQDGFMDFFQAGLSGHPLLFMNNGLSQGNPNHWLELKLVGTTSNRDAVGARIVASVGGVNLLRTVVNGGAFQGSNSLIQHFGLGAATQVDTLTVYWPSGEVQTLSNVAAGQRMTITEQ